MWKNIDYEKLDAMSKFRDQVESVRQARENQATNDAHAIIGLIDEGAALSPAQTVEVLGCGENNWSDEDQEYALNYIKTLSDDDMEDLNDLLEDKPSQKMWLISRSQRFKDLAKAKGWLL